MRNIGEPTPQELINHFGEEKLTQYLSWQLEEEYSPVQAGLIVEAPFAPGILQTVRIEEYGPDPTDWRLRFDTQRYREKIEIFLEGKLTEYMEASARLYGRAI